MTKQQTKPRERPVLFSTDMMRRLLAGEKTQTRRLIEWQPLEDGLNLDFSGLSVGEYSTGHPRFGYVLRSRGGGGCWQDRTKPLRCKLGYAGDMLWTRETWAAVHFWPEHSEGYETGYCDDCEGSKSIPKDNKKGWWTVCYESDNHEKHFDDRGWHWRPSIHMPRWASRCTLELTRDRLPERLRSITEEDALAEGFRPSTYESWSAYDPSTEGYPSFAVEPTAEDIARFGYQNVRHHGPKVIATARDAFRTYWDGQYGKRDGGRYSWDANPWVQPYEFKVVEVRRG